MANQRDETRTGTVDSTAGTPQVQVFDTNRTGDVRTASNAGYVDNRTTAAGTPATVTRSGANWSMIILSLLIIAAVIFLLMWLF